MDFGDQQANDQYDALHDLTQMMVGQPKLADNPGALFALMQTKATPAEGQMIGQYMQGLEAQKRVELARAAGAASPDGPGNYIKLSTNETKMLDAMGVQYKDVVYTPQVEAKLTAKAVADHSDGKRHVVLNADGTLAKDDKGRTITVGVTHHDDGGFFSGIADAIGSVGEGLWDGVSTVGHVAMEGYNFVQGGVIKAGENLVDYFNPEQQVAVLNQTTGKHGAPVAAAERAKAEAEDMRLQGYDPNSIFSSLAFQASGKAHIDLTDLYDQYGEDAVNEAIRFSNDPNGVLKEFIGKDGFDPDKGLSPEAVAKYKYFQSKEFQTLQKRLVASHPTFGNVLASTVGLDPTADSAFLGMNPFQMVSLTTDLVAMFTLDPLVVVAGASRAAKIEQIGINGFGDTQRAADILAGTVKGVKANRVRRGWQDAIDMADGIRKARAEGNTVAEAQLVSKFQSELPTLSPIMEDFIGHNGFLGFTNEGKVWRGELAFSDAGPGIRSLEDASLYVQRKGALLQLVNGRAATQAGFMPGGVSAYGWRRLKGTTSAFMTAQSARRGEKAYKSTIAGLEADPMKAKAWEEAELIRILPEPGNYVSGVHADNAQVVSFKTDSAADSLRRLHEDALGDAEVEAAAMASFREELSGLDAKLSELEAHIKTYGANLKYVKGIDPEEIYKLRSYVQEGQELYSMAAKGHKIASREARVLEGKLRQVEEAVNHRIEGVGLLTSKEEAWAGKYGEYGVGLDNSPKLKSAARGEQGKIELTEAGKGAVLRSSRSRRYAKSIDAPLAEVNPLLGSTKALIERTRLSATRFGALLPRNQQIDILASDSGDKVYKFARTYLTRGDAALYRAKWASATAGERKLMVQGLVEQLGHAAGLGRTKTGQDLLLRLRNTEESYAAHGVDITVDGQKAALTEGQTRTVWNLPTFQQLQQAAHKAGLYEATFGRPMTAALTDQLMAQLKMGWLFKPSTVTRNQLEGWLRTALEGKLGKAVEARAFLTARNRELWNRGVHDSQLERYTDAAKEIESLKAAMPKMNPAEKAKARKQLVKLNEEVNALSSIPRVQHHLAVEAGDTETAKSIADATMLSGQTLGRSTLLAKLTGEISPKTRVGKSLIHANWPMVKMAEAYRSMRLKDVDEATLRAFETMPQDDLVAAMEGYAQQVIQGNLGFHAAAIEADEIAQAGFGPATIKWAVHRGKERALARTKATSTTGKWTLQATDDTVGADRYTNHLHRLIDKNPETARAIALAIEQRLASGSYLDPTFKAVQDALSYEAKHTTFGKIVADDVVNRPGEFRRAVDESEVALGKQQFAEHLVKEFEYALQGADGSVRPELVNFILENGKAPTSSWVKANLQGLAKPKLVPAPEVMAMAPGGKAGFAESLIDLEGSAYQWLVERPLQRTTSSPVFLVHYAEARKSLNPLVEQLITDSGFSRAAAEKLAQESAIKQAWIKTEQLIDDPGQKTQFDVVARNFFPFARATNAMIRRWGTGLYQNPVAARRMMLAYEGAEHSGMIYTNNYGEDTFVYPTSGVFNGVLRSLSALPFVGELAHFPLSADMTGSTMLAVPGADNPFRFSMGPIISMPIRTMYKHLFPQSARADWEKLDAAINGPIGVGEVWGQVVPTIIRQGYRNLTDDDRTSALASSTNGAFANLAAAGYIPPPDASPSEIKLFQSRLQTQVRSQLFLRFAFGLFAPSPASKPTEETSGSHADYAWNVRGLQGLSDEFKAILNDTGGDVAHANAIFTALHPDEVVFKDDGSYGKVALPGSAYEEPMSGSTTPKAQLVSTDSALRWYETNAEFLQRYKSVGAYFIPKESLGDSFSQGAYDFQLELGLRERKTPDEYMADVYTRSEEAQYYNAVDQYDAKIAAAKAAGQDDVAKRLQDGKGQWQAEYKARNPFLAQKLRNFMQAQDVAEGQVRDLRAMLKNGDVPQEHRALLSSILTTWDAYKTYVTTPGKTQPQKNAARQMLDTWAKDNVANTPLADLYNGIFRSLNNKLTKVEETTNV